MDSKRYPNNIDDIIDEANEYHTLFDYVTDGKLVTENELKFNGDIELAKKYEDEEAATALINLYNQVCYSIDDDVPICSTVSNDESLKTDNESQNEEFKEENIDLLDTSHQINFSLVRYIPPQIHITTFQTPHEPRIKYLLRSLKLWQEFLNSGDIDKLQVLFNDILEPNLLVRLNDASPPIVSRQKWCDFHLSFLGHVPDFCVFYSNITRTKRRVVTLKCNTFGSLPYVNNNTDDSKSVWNYFEHTPIEKWDEHHKIQKQKYDTLKSQNKIIKFEKRAIWYLMLSRDLKRFTKLMAGQCKFDIY